MRVIRTKRRENIDLRGEGKTTESVEKVKKMYDQEKYERLIDRQKQTETQTIDI